MSHSYSGVIRYTSQQQGRLGQARGREQFVITLNDDGSRSLRSHVIIQDAPMVERDVVLSVDASFHPRSAQVRIRVGDDREGQALFICDAHRIYGSGRTIEGEDFQECWEGSAAATFFVTHPIQADAWLLGGLGFGTEPDHRQISHFPTCSLDHRGASGPRLMVHEPPLDIFFLGEEAITIEAGQFAALHFCYGDPAVDPEGSNQAGGHPRYHIWTSSDGNFIVLRARVDGYMQTRYELASLTQGPSGTVPKQD